MKKAMIKVIGLIVGTSLMVAGLIILKPASKQEDAVLKNDNPVISAEAKAAGANKAWLSQVMESIQTKKLQASQDKNGNWQLPNQRNNFQVSFVSGQVELKSRKNENDKKINTAKKSWYWKWQTAWLGRPGAMQKAGNSKTKVSGNLVEYKYKGFTEWYKNKPEGLEQGFTIHKRPEGKTNDVKILSRPIHGVKGKVIDNGQGIEFLDDNNVAVLRYAALKAWDATGRVLKSIMKLEGILLA